MHSFKHFQLLIDWTLLACHSAKSTYKMLWNEVQMLMLLPHGQATVERGFSFN
jgi:hypothetical protein